jgi:hypothetical protein
MQLNDGNSYSAFNLLNTADTTDPSLDLGPCGSQP